MTYRKILQNAVSSFLIALKFNTHLDTEPSTKFQSDMNILKHQT